MTVTSRGEFAAVGFHGGELAVQERAGVRAQSARLSTMVGAGELRPGMALFLSRATFAVITARDASGRLWTSSLTGDPGFLRATSPTTLALGSPQRLSGPLFGMPAGQRAGMLVIDFDARKRLRINGIVNVLGAELALSVEQSYGNCPQYIQRRQLQRCGEVPESPSGFAFEGDALRPVDLELIHGADTFFLGTTHPQWGTDASHRGGAVGFVRADATELGWPDYPGNNMFNSLGNLAIDPSAALLFVDFRDGRLLHLSGRAALYWNRGRTTGEDADTGRWIEFRVERVITAADGGICERNHSPYPHNPPLTDD